MDSKQLANKARKSISNYCINECSAYCCRKGYLIVSKKELDLIDSGKKGDVKELEDGNFSLNMNKTPCPSLSGDFTCGVHMEKDRPQTCKDFPLFIKGDKVHLSTRCFAVKENMFFAFIKEFEGLGFKVDIVEE